MTSLDPRLNAVRPDLADSRLEGKVQAARLVDGERRQVRAASAPLRRLPRPSAPLDTELLCGEIVRQFEARDGWAWVQSEADGYVGYTLTDALSVTVEPVTYRLCVPRSFVYPRPDLKAPPLGVLSLEAGVVVDGEDAGFLALRTGDYVHAAHLRPVDAPMSDPVTVALGFLNAPYLWGGRTSLGLDCSALVQLAHLACGVACPRDTDMQEAGFGAPVAFDGDEGNLERGDLVFWKRHVGIWIDRDRFLHTNAGDMLTAVAPLARVAAGIEARLGDRITSVRRPPRPGNASPA